MSATNWDNAAPAGTQAANLVDDFIRETRLAIYDRIRQGGQRMTNAGADGGNDGKHVPIDGSGNPDDTGEFNIWDAAGTTKKVRLYGATHATNPNRSEFPGEVYAGSAGTSKLAGIATAAWARVIVADGFPVVGYIKAVVYKVPEGAPNRTVKRVKVVVDTRPTSASLQVELRYRTAANCTDATNRFNDTNNNLITTVTLTNASANYAAEQTGLAQTLSAGDELTIQYPAVNGAFDVTTIIQIE